MKPFLSILLLILSLQLSGQSFRVMTYNIRFDNPDDPKNWNERKYAVADLIHYYQPHIFGIQEGECHQVKYLDDRLANFTRAGVGRDDGHQKGEFSAIFFDTTRFELVQQSTFWLSETPENVSIGWDASMERICTYVLLKNKPDGSTLWVFNAHFDHKGEKSRIRSAQLILDQIKWLAGDSGVPVILMGDFNSIPEDVPIALFRRELLDSRQVVLRKSYGPEGTFNGFDLQSEQKNRIDYIFVKELKVLKQIHIDDQMDDHFYPSDHFPVMAELETLN